MKKINLQKSGLKYPPLIEIEGGIRDVSCYKGRQS